jgi:RNA polymerase sigma-70 factor (ECF subfamily)
VVRELRDDELIKRIQGGDRSALDEAVNTYYGDIYHFLCRKLSDVDAAQDVAQTVFVKFAGSIPRYHERGKLKNYLFKLAANAGNDYFRKALNYVSLED